MAEYLDALASVCETAQKMQVPKTVCNPATPTMQTVPQYYSSRPTTVGSEVEARIRDLLQSQALSYHQQVDLHPQSFVYPQPPQMMSTPAPLQRTIYTPYPTPPSTPENQHYTPAPLPVQPSQTIQGPVQPSQTIVQGESHHLNPVLKNLLAHTQFHQYLDETWPEDAQRRGAAVIRASVYNKIAEVLQGGEATTRFKHWVKKTEFFLVECMQSMGAGYGACLAVPVGRTRASSSSKKKTVSNKAQSQPRHSYKLVARLEDFVYIIGTYHNDQKGHHGIRKTYGLVQEDFSYVPRSAVAKFIELCEVCALHKTNKTSGRRSKENESSTKMLAAEKVPVEDSTDGLDSCNSSSLVAENEPLKAKDPNSLAEHETQ